MPLLPHHWYILKLRRITLYMTPMATQTTFGSVPPMRLIQIMRAEALAHINRVRVLYLTMPSGEEVSDSVIRWQKNQLKNIVGKLVRDCVENGHSNFRDLTQEQKAEFVEVVRIELRRLVLHNGEILGNPRLL